jgi:hypothetical protein
MQQSGGLLLAAALGGKTLIFASGKNANESPAGSIEYERPEIRIFGGSHGGSHNPRQKCKLTIAVLGECPWWEALQYLHLQVWADCGMIKERNRRILEVLPWKLDLISAGSRSAIL